jgi:hypothetical protein
VLDLLRLLSADSFKNNSFRTPRTLWAGPLPLTTPRTDFGRGWSQWNHEKLDPTRIDQQPLIRVEEVQSCRNRCQESSCVYQHFRENRVSRVSLRQKWPKIFLNTKKMTLEAGQYYYWFRLIPHSYAGGLAVSPQYQVSLLGSRWVKWHQFWLYWVASGFMSKYVTGRVWHSPKIFHRVTRPDQPNYFIFV